MEFSVILFGISFLAGLLTVFAPCIFTFLPVILVGSSADGSKNYRRALIITISLGLSVVIFTLLLRVSTAFLSIPLQTWDIIAGSIILIQGIIILLPQLWTKVSEAIGLGRTQSKISKNTGAVMTGLALGPIFSSCSPTYGYIIAVVIQNSFTIGFIYLLTYVFGLSLMLFLISILGSKLTQGLKFGTNPNGMFKRTLGILFILLGLFIMTGFYKQVETFIIQNIPALDITRIDRSILQENI